MTYYARVDGCIVTAELPNGKLVVRHRDGGTYDALREIIATLPEGSTVQSISTPRTILRDLRYPPRQRARRKRRSPITDPFAAPPEEADPWAVERSLLAKLDRLDLLPPQMQRPANGRVHPLRR